MPKPVKTREVTCQIYQNGKHLTVEEAMELIGWEITEGPKFHLRDVQGNRIFLRNNATNRPFRPGLMKRYMLEYLRKKWALNGESIIFDWDNKCQSGQHRLCGLIMAEETRREQKEKWKKYWTKPVTAEALVVKGIDPKVADTIDQGQKRSFGDVIYRSEFFGEGSGPLSLGEGKHTETLPPMGMKQRQRLANILSHAVRLVWLRVTDKSVSDAPHFPVSEGLDFLGEHPLLCYAVAFIDTLNGGETKGGEKISRFLSLGYASGLFYLMATSGTDPDDYAEDTDALDLEMMQKAKDFWVKLSKGTELKENEPVYVVRELLPKINAGSAIGRDEIVATVIKAFNAFVDGKKVKTADLVVKKKTDEKGVERLVDSPRLGGLDVEGAEKPATPEQINAEETTDDREGERHAKGKWSVGDSCWVKGFEGDNYFGTIQEVYKAEDGQHVMIEADDGQVWDEPIGRLHLKYPG